MPRAEAADTASEPAGAPSRARLFVFVAWCVWLLAWLVPSMLLAPRAPDPRPWMAAETAPAAVLAAAALFLVAAWPFWPALVSPNLSGNPAGRAGRATQGDPRGAGSLLRLVGLSAVEAVVLGALAAPFLVVGWSLGGRLAVWPAAATAAGLAVLGIGLRVAVTGMPGGAGRRLMAGTLLVCGGPPAVCYALAETVGTALPWLLEASPVVALVQAGTEGWSAGGWSQVARLWLWPSVGVGLGALGALMARRRDG